MGRLVRILKGDWIKGDYAKWEFRSDPSDLGYGITVSDTENYDTLGKVIGRTSNTNGLDIQAASMDTGPDSDQWTVGLYLDR
ncbi:unnamed protein product [Arabis nemorensis]|uniref:Uncharacterized protein n=1 Tax=Arabis nemorensis TaxID=586526 RepID=A0A565BHY7_9BRAS|nr:unnamed protein product [Arabis nemorensis]